MAYTAETFGSGTTALRTDTQRVLLSKMLTAINGGGSGGGGSGSVVAWDGTGSKPSATGTAWLIGTHGSAVDGLIWTKTTAGTNNTDWVAF